MCIHVPGFEVIASAQRSETDFGSDAKLDSVVGQRVSDEFWDKSDKIAAAVQSAGLRLSLDLFATESNRRAERYYSRYGEAESEAVDTFMMLDWARATASSWALSIANRCTASRPSASSKPQCGRPSWMRGYACCWCQWSGSCCWILAPADTAHQGLCPTTDSFVQIRNQRTALHLAGNFDPKELALFVCYYSLLSGWTALLVP